MKEKLEDITKRLAAIGNELNAIRRESGTETETNLDAASESVHDAIEQLEEIVERD